MRLSATAGPVFAAGVATAALVFSPTAYDPNAPRWLAVAALAAFALVALSIKIRRSAARFDALDAATLALVGYLGLSLFWTPDPAQGAASLAVLCGSAGIFVFARRSFGGDGPIWLASGCQAALASLLVLQLAGGVRGGGLGNENFLSESLAALLPLASFPAARDPRDPKSWIWLAVPLAAASTICFVLPTKSGVAALAAIAIVAFLAGWGPVRRLGVISRAGGLVLLVAATVLFLWLRGLSELAASFASRLELAVNTIYLWHDHAIFGTGLGGFEPLYPAYQERHFNWFGDRGGLLTVKSLRAGAAHNEPVQFLSTAGVTGVLVPFAVWIGVNRFIPASAALWTTERHAAGATLAALLAVGLTGFPLQMPLTLLLFSISLGRFLPAAPGYARPGPVLAIPAASLTGACMLALAALNWVGQERLGLAQRNLSVDPVVAERAHDAARSIAPWDYTTRMSRFVTYARAHEVDPSLPYDPMQANELYALSAGRGTPEMQVAMARVQLLQNSPSPTGAELAEMTALGDALVARATLVPDTWLLAAILSLRRGDVETARSAIAQGRRLRERINTRRLEPALSRADQIAAFDALETIAAAQEAGALPSRISVTLGFGVF